MPQSVAILIPAYEPGDALLRLVDDLIQGGAQAIVVVNDGSSAASGAVFEALEGYEGVTTLTHEKNQGKGQALKTGINHIIRALPGAAGIVTADADGQHRPGDVLNVAHALSQSPRTLILGTRRFGPDTPLRSRIGNLATTRLFSLMLRCPISDTQTGLRGLPMGFAREILSLPSSGYDFEFESLAMGCRQGVPRMEVPISTVYLDGNKGSHFNPILDSMKIYFVFFRFIASSLVVSAIDAAVFSLFYFASGHLLFSFVAGRGIAGVSQFCLSKRFVFNSRRGLLWEVAKYVALVAVLTTAAYQAVSLIVAAGGNAYLAKIVVETLLFFTSFALQRLFVFIQ